MIKRYFKDNSNFVYVKMSSTIDDMEILSHLGKLNRSAKTNTALFELCDLRELSYNSNFTLIGFENVKARIRTCTNLAKIEGKFAIVVANSFQRSIAEWFIKLASEILSASESQIFYNYYDAIEFLKTEESLSEIEKFLEEIQ